MNFRKLVVGATVAVVAFAAGRRSQRYQDNNEILSGKRRKQHSNASNPDAKAMGQHRKARKDRQLSELQHTRDDS